MRCKESGPRGEKKKAEKGEKGHDDEQGVRKPSFDGLNTNFSRTWKEGNGEKIYRQNRTNRTRTKNAVRFLSCRRTKSHPGRKEGKRAVIENKARKGG